MAEKKGLLVVIEGIDGSGKSTQVRLLARRLRQMGLEVAVFREPTRGTWGRKIRQQARRMESMNPGEELELFLRDREDNVRRNILPALSSRKIVLLDRYYFSTMAYQGARGIDPRLIRRRNEAFAPHPDCVFILDLSAAEGLSRIHHRRQKDILFEQEGYLERVAGIFKRLRGKGIYHLDAREPRDKIHGAIFSLVQQLLRKRGIDR